MNSIRPSIWRRLWRAEIQARNGAARATSDSDYRRLIGYAERCLTIRLRIEARAEVAR